MYTDPQVMELQKIYHRRRRFRQMRNQLWFLVGTALLTAGLHMCCRAETGAADIPVFTRPAAVRTQETPQGPVFLGLGDKTVYVGQRVSYLEGVTAWSGGENTHIEVDASAVDLNRPGRYSVTYTASGASGGETRAVITVVVREAPGYPEV